MNETWADTEAKVWLLCLYDGPMTFAGKVLIMPGHCLAWPLQSAFTAARSPSPPSLLFPAGLHVTQASADFFAFTLPMKAYTALSIWVHNCRLVRKIVQGQQNCRNGIRKEELWWVRWFYSKITSFMSQGQTWVKGHDTEATLLKNEHWTAMVLGFYSENSGRSWVSKQITNRKGLGNVLQLQWLPFFLKGKS